MEKGKGKVQHPWGLFDSTAKRTWLRSPPEVSARVRALPVILNKKVRINKVLTEGWTEIENNGNPEGLGEGRKKDK
jgi:hypothetical protein